MIVGIMTLIEERLIHTYPFTLRVLYAFGANANSSHTIKYWADKIKSATVLRFLLMNYGSRFRQSSPENKEVQYLTDRDWDFLLTTAEEIKFEPEHVIIRTGEEFENLYRIKKGTGILLSI